MMTFLLKNIATKSQRQKEHKDLVPLLCLRVLVAKQQLQ